MRTALFIIINFLVFDFFSQTIDLFREGKYDEYEIILLKNYKQIDKLKKAAQINTLTDLGKVRIIKKDYIAALAYLLEAKKRNVGDSLIYSHYNTVFGQIFTELKAYSIAIEYYKKEINKPNNLLNNYFQLSTVASLYLSINQTDSAETYFKKQLEESYKMNDYIAKASSINNLGITKITKKDYLNALKLFDKSLEFLDNYNKKISEYFENERESFRKSILSNIIESHYHLKNYKKVDYFYKIFCNNNIKKFPSLELKSIVLDAYIKLNNIEQINKIIEEIRPFENQFTSGNNLIYLKMLLNYAQYKNDLKDIKLLIKKIDLLEKEVQQDEKIKNDKMNNIVSHFLITQATEKINFEKKQKNQLKQEIKLKQQKQSLLTSTIIFIIIGFTLFLFIIYQLNRNKRKKSDLEKQFLLLEEDKMKHKIKVQENILTDLSIEKRIRDTNNREILKNLSYLKRCDESKIKQEIHQLILNINNNDIHHIDHDALKGVSEEYIIHFKIKLLEQNPKLSDADINLCLLIKLNFSNKAIAEYKNITYSSVKIFKNRLKKKLSLNSESSLSEYIHNLN